MAIVRTVVSALAFLMQILMADAGESTAYLDPADGPGSHTSCRMGAYAQRAELWLPTDWTSPQFPLYDERQGSRQARGACSGRAFIMHAIMSSMLPHSGARDCLDIV